MDDDTPTTRPVPPLSEDLAVLDEHAEAVLAQVTERVKALNAEYIRGFKALMLAPTIFTYHALLRGERVPWNMLLYLQAQRYGLRRRIRGVRVALDDFNDVPKS